MNSTCAPLVRSVQSMPGPRSSAGHGGLAPRRRCRRSRWRSPARRSGRARSAAPRRWRAAAGRAAGRGRTRPAPCRGPEVGRDGLDARGDVADVGLGRVVRDAVRAVARDRRVQQARGQVGAHGGEVVGAVVRGEHEHAAVEREVVGHAEAAVHRQPVAVAAGVDPVRAGPRRVEAALVGHRDLHVRAWRCVAREGFLEQVVDRLDAEVRDEEPSAARAARVGLGDPAPPDVEHDGRAVRVRHAERDGVGGPVQQRQPPSGVERARRRSRPTATCRRSAPSPAASRRPVCRRGRRARA